MDSSIPRREALKRLGAGAAGLVASAACGRGDGPTNPRGDDGDPSVITLSGSGFGTKDPVEPLLYQTYEDLALGADHLDAGFDPHTGTGDTEGLTHEVQDSTVHSGSKCLRTECAGGSVFEILGKTFADTEKLYTAHWYRWETDGDPSEGPVYKVQRSNGQDEVYSGLPSHAVNVFPGDPDWETQGGDTFWNPGPNNEPRNVDCTNAGTADRDEWKFEEQSIKLSTPGEVDGFWKHYGSGNPSLDPSTSETGNDPYVAIENRESGFNELIDSYLVHAGIEKWSDTTTYWLYTDQTLIDTTFARVIVTDNNSYYDSTEFEPQAPTSWSDTEIQIGSPNWGNFTSGQTVYFHVWDSDDNYVSAHERAVP